MYRDILEFLVFQALTSFALVPVLGGWYFNKDGERESLYENWPTYPRDNAGGVEYVRMTLNIDLPLKSRGIRGAETEQLVAPCILRMYAVVSGGLMCTLLQPFNKKRAIRGISLVPP